MADPYSSGVLPNGARMPESVRARMLAGQLMAQSAGASSAPYTSKGVAALKGIEGLMGGLMEGSAYRQAQQGQMQGNASMIALANALQGGGGGAQPQPGGGAPMPAAMPAGVGSDAVASGSARNPGGYDPRATEALIRSRAPAFNIDPDTAVKVARSEGLNVYHGDGGSSFGPFQLHYGGVAGGGNKVGGLGDVFTRQTGLDARDPSTVPQQVDFALSQAAKGGWGPWHGAQRIRLGNFAGIGQGGGTTTASADMPAPNARPVSMAGLPPGVTPAMWAASQGQGGPTDGNALNRSVETPVGTQPYAPGAGPQGPSAPPIGPATSNAAMAQALQSWKPDLGQTQPAVVPDPVSASAPDAAPPPSILPPARPPSGDVAGAPVVPPPTGNLDALVTGAMAKAGYDPSGLPGADAVGAGLAAGKDVALDPVVPDPQGSMVPPAPSSPNGALAGPQSDAAMGNDGGPLAASVPPQASLPATAPMPPLGAQSIQGPPAASAPPPGLDVGDPGLDAMRAGMVGQGGAASSPAARQALATALGGSPPPVPPGQVNVDQSAGPAPIAALGATPDAPSPGSSPGSAPLPTFASARMPGPTPMPPQPGTGAALPATGPMPPAGGQSMGSGSSLPQTGPMPPPGVQSVAGLNPDAPAPGAVPTGPAPLPPQAMAAALQSFGGSGTNAPPGNSAAADPASAQNFMRQEMARQLGGGAPGAPPAPMPAPGPSSGPMGGGLGGMLGGLFGGGQQAVPMAPDGGSPPAMAPQMGGNPQQLPAGQGGAPSSWGYDQARAAATAILQNPYASPAAQEMAGKILFPQVQPITGANGQVYAFNPATRQMTLLADVGAKFTPNESLYQGGRFTQAPDKPMDLAPGHTAVTFGANNAAIPQVRAPETPDFKPLEGTGSAFDAHSGNAVQLPAGAGAFNTSIKLPGGTEVPIRVTPGVNGGQPRVEYLTPGGASGQGGDPLGGVQPLVDRAQAMQAQGAAQSKEAEGQVASLGKLGDQGLEARAKLNEIAELKKLSNGFGSGYGTALAAWLGNHGITTANSSDQAAYEGLAGYLATGMRQAGSGALRTAEMDRFQADLGNTKMTPADRSAALDRAANMFGRVADVGDIARNGRLSPQARMDQIGSFAGQPYGVPAGSAPQGGGQPSAPQAQPPASSAPVQVQTPQQAMSLPPGTVFVTPDGRRKVR